MLLIITLFLQRRQVISVLIVNLSPFWIPVSVSVIKSQISSAYELCSNHGLNTCLTKVHCKRS